MSQKPMPPREQIARMIARALGHNDELGMYWERYVCAADLILSETRLMFTKEPAQ